MLGCSFLHKKECAGHHYCPNVVVIIIKTLNLSKPEIKFYVDSASTCDVSEICDGENL